MNALRYDAMALGNYDLALGWASLAHALAAADFPWLAANLERPWGGTVLPPYRVLERNGVRVGVLGLTTPGAAAGLHPRHLDDMALRDLERTARRWVPVLREVEAADVVIALLHSGMDGAYRREEAIRTGRPLYAAGGRLAEGVPGLDLIVSGGAHRLSPYASSDGATPYGTPVLEAGALGRGLAVAQFALEAANGRWSITEVRRHTLRAAATPDTELLATVAHELQRTRERLAEPTRARFRRVPRKAAFVACAGALSHATAALLTGEDPAHLLSLLPAQWVYEPPTRDERGQPVRRAHLYRWQRYPERLVKAHLTGRQIEHLLDGYVRHRRGWRVSPLAVLWPGGLEATIAPGGSRLQSLTRQAGGRSIRPHALYPVWLTQFVWYGGLGLAPEALLQPDWKLREVEIPLRAGLFALLNDPRFALPEACRGWLALAP